MDAAMFPTSLWASFSFLTRLAPARIFTSAELAASARWFPVTGLALGLLTCLPLRLGVSTEHVVFQALLYVGLMTWFSRGQHWDGMLDCLDAWGSGRQDGEGQNMLEFARLGSFGALGLLFFLLIQIIGAAHLLAAHSAAAWGVLILAPALGRAFMLVPAALLPPRRISTLGRLVAPGCTPFLALIWNAALLLVYGAFSSPRAMLVYLTAIMLVLLVLHRMARGEDGFDGDFMGFACVLSECAALAAPLI